MTTSDRNAAQGSARKLVLHPRSQIGIEPVLLILLPGLNFKADDFVTHGFLAALHRGGSSVDALVMKTDLNSYLDGTITRQLVELIAEKRHHHYSQIWLAGISLGCFGALLAASAAPEMVDGAILLSPFLGTPGLIAEIERSGGLSSWQPGAIAANDPERRVCAWLKSHTGAERRTPILYLGYGKSDRFAAAATLVASELPPRQRCVVDGGHDWSTWTDLWQRIVNAQPFAGP